MEEERRRNGNFAHVFELHGSSAWKVARRQKTVQKVWTATARVLCFFVAWGWGGPPKEVVSSSSKLLHRTQDSSRFFKEAPPAALKAGCGGSFLEEALAPIIWLLDFWGILYNKTNAAGDTIPRR